jgi:Cu/Ag efflux protein CusF
MKFGFSAAALLLMSIAGAYAADTDGEIKSIDRENQTITLANGEKFKLPGEFDLSALEEGMDVVIAYDEVDGEKLITDMQLPETE